MSPLAQYNTAADPTLDLTSTRPAAAIALGAPETPAPAATAAQATDATLILSAFSPATRRQLELTVNALSRSFRKAIRHAERLERDDAPIEEQDAAWERVSHRSALLQDFLKSLSLPTLLPPAAAASTEVPAPAPAPVPAANDRPRLAPETAPAANITPANDEDNALFAECLTEFRRIRALPTSCRAERRRKEQAGHALIKRVNRHGDTFANRVLQAMQEIDAADH